MEKKIVFAILIMAMFMEFGTIQAQTYAYRLIKKVSKYGEVKEVESSNKIYVTFKNNKNTFYISKRDGSRAGKGDLSTGYASGFNNMNLDPQNFNFSNKQNGVLIYKNNRPLRAIKPGVNTFDLSHTGVGILVKSEETYIYDYVIDYAKFNSDYSRINVIPNQETGTYGTIPFGILKWDIQSDITTFVFERVKEPNANNQDFY